LAAQEAIVAADVSAAVAAAEQVSAHDKCTRQHAVTAEKRQKFPLNQQTEGPSTARIATRIIKSSKLKQRDRQGSGMFFYIFFNVSIKHYF
jgi:hypothetical protein